MGALLVNLLRKPAAVEMLLLVALLLAGISFLGPWVDHAAAALKLSGQDMGEFVKFIPTDTESRLLPRQLFYFSPLATTACLVLLAANGATHYSRWLRAIMLGVALLFLPGLLPPAWGHPKELFAAEFRLQGLALVAGLLLVLGHGLLRRVPLRATLAIVAGLAVVALLSMQGAFWSMKARVWETYHTPTIHLGWGLWLHIAAWVGTIALAVIHLIALNPGFARALRTAQPQSQIT
jgi:hypothetical protein